MKPIRFNEGVIFPTQDAMERNVNAIENTKLYNGKQSLVYLPAFLKRLEMNGVKHFTYAGDQENYIGFDNEVIQSYYKTVLQGVNYTKAVCQLYSNLLFSEGVIISDYDDLRNSWLKGEENERGQKITKGFVIENDLNRKFLGGQREAGYKGNAVYLIKAVESKKTISGLKAEVSIKPSEMWYPVMSNSDYDVKIGDSLVQSFNLSKEDLKKYGYKNNKSAKELLRVVIYEVGKNTYKSFVTSNGIITKQVPWDEKVLGTLPEGVTQDGLDWIEDTGYSYSMLQVVYNDRTTDSLFGKPFISTSFKEQEREVCIRATQRGRILDKNSDPGMTGPVRNIGVDPSTGKQIVQTQGKYFPTKKDDPKVEYVTWDGNLDENREAENKAKEYIYTETGTNEASLGATTEGLSALSGVALERVLMRPLSTTKALIIEWKPIIENIVKLGYEIEFGEDQLFPNIGWNDGLPKSRKEDLEDIMIANGGLPVLNHADSIQKAFPGYTRKQSEQEALDIEAEIKRREIPLIEIPEVL